MTSFVCSHFVEILTRVMVCYLLVKHETQKYAALKASEHITIIS